MPQPAQQHVETTLTHKQGTADLVTGTESFFPHSRVEADSSTIISAETAVSRSGNTSIPHTTSENVLYDDIMGFRKEQVCTIHFSLDNLS